MAELLDRPLGELTDAELFCFAARVEASGDPDRAFSLFQTLMQREQQPGLGQFAVGRLLLDRGDESGIAMIETVMQNLPRTIVPGCELIIRYLLATGRESEARPYIDNYRLRQETDLS